MACLLFWLNFFSSSLMLVSIAFVILIKYFNRNTIKLLTDVDIKQIEILFITQIIIKNLPYNDIYQIYYH